MKNKIKGYKHYLISEEKSDATVKKYIRDVQVFIEWLGGGELSKRVVQEYKRQLMTEYAIKSVNSIISSLNSFFEWCDHSECKVKNPKIQKEVFCEPNRELTREEYECLLRTAKEQGKKRLCLVMQTICSTGIRISELKYITVEAVKTGAAMITCKGKNRKILIPPMLCKILKPYVKEQNIRKGSIFITKRENPIDRSNVWAEMKKLCKRSGVLATKVFPHNLRHLFGKRYYALFQDISRLADILGHTSINTTRIYTIESGETHRTRIQKLGLIFDLFSENTT